MDKKYGEKLDTIRTFPFVSIGYLILGVIILAVGVGLLIAAFSSGNGSGLAFKIFLTLVGIILLTFSIVQMTVCNVSLYENGIIARTTFKSHMLDRDKIYAIYWHREGANSVNSRAPRRNQALAEVIMRGGKTGFKMSSGYYRDLDNKLGLYQEKYKISREV